MAFELGRATHITTPHGIHQVSSAYQYRGRRVALIPLTSTDLHAGHLAVVHAAKQLNGAISIVAAPPGIDRTPLFDAHVDAIYTYTDADLWPAGPRTLVDANTALTRILSLVGIVDPTDIFLGEKDIWQLVTVQRMITDLHLSVKLQAVPTVRTPEGLPVALDNTRIPVANRDQAIALSASLIAGIHAAGDGAEAVLAATRSVLAAAEIEPDYLEVHSPMLGPAPQEGDARLVVAATIGGVPLTDSVRLVLG